jgi:hypothetical protein
MDTTITKTKQGAANSADLFMSRKVTEREQMLALSIDPDFFKALTRLNFQGLLGIEKNYLPDPEG